MRNRQISDLQQPYHPTQKNEPAPAYTETDSLLPCEVTAPLGLPQSHIQRSTAGLGVIPSAAVRHEMLFPRPAR